MEQTQQKKRSRFGERLRRAGFDLTTYDRSSGYYRVRCSQCQSMIVQGLAIHEKGCPNERRADRR